MGGLANINNKNMGATRLIPVARLLNNQTVVGCRVKTEQGQTLDLSKAEFMNCTRQGMFDNIRMNGNTPSGINGFKLRDLPTINISVQVKQQAKQQGEIKTYSILK